MLIPEIAQKVWSGDLRLPDGVLLVGDALRVTKLGHSDSLVVEVNVEPVVVLRPLIDLKRHAHTFRVVSLIVRTADVVVELSFSFEIVGFVAGNS